MNDKLFPIQSGTISNIRPVINYPRTYIPWWLAEKAYEVYVKRYGDCQTLERIAERGGFGRNELLELLKNEF